VPDAEDNAKREAGVWKDVARMEAEVIDPGDSVTVEVPRDVIDEHMPPSIGELETNRFPREQVDGILDAMPPSQSAQALKPSAFGPQPRAPLGASADAQSMQLTYLVIAMLVVAAAGLAFLIL
jgi:hypothetical protein